jgi:type IV secretion system protein VirB4
MNYASFLNISKPKPKGQRVFDNEYKSSKFIGVKSHWSEDVLLMTDNRLMQVIKLGGFSFETADDEDLDIKKSLRNSLFKGVGDSNAKLYTHIIRKKQVPYPQGYINPDMPYGFTAYLDKKWVARSNQKESFINEIYISIIYKASYTRNIVKDIQNKIFKKDHTDHAWEHAMNDAHDGLSEVSSRIISSLYDYTPEILGIEEVDGIKYSKPAEFISKIINGVESRRIIYTLDDLSKHIVNSRVIFKNKLIEIKQHDGRSKFAGIVSIKEYGPKTWAGILDSFLKMPFEFVISQSYCAINRQVAMNKMQLQQNRMIQSEDKAVSQVIEISEALDKAMSGEIGFGNHHMTVMCIEENLKALESVLSMALVEVSSTGGMSVREKTNMEPAFWSQVPGNFHLIGRHAVINTNNLAAFNSFHNYPLGKPDHNFWGDAVTVLDTTSGTPYYFNFHLRDIGHTTIIGPTGAGKTVLMNFLSAQAQKFRCRLFFFDKDRGAEIFLRAINGTYTIIDPGQKCGFNPLLLPDTGENRIFLLEWLKQLVSTLGEQVSAEDISLLSAAINGNYKLTPENRRLSNIAPFLGLEGPGTLAGRLAMWHSNGSHAKIFDNDNDVIDFSQANIFGFEMAELLKDKFCLAPVLLYLFHRINISLDGSPTMIVLDEAWALIDNPVFAPKIKDWLKVLRKLNTFIVFATQSVEDASKSAISDTLIQQTATQIFLPNLKATEVYRTAFLLSEREHHLIRTIDPGSRFFLIKQGVDAVIARVDLSGMGDIINILSGRADTVLILDSVIRDHGNDPEVWIPIFNEKIKSLQSKQ